MNFFDFFLNLFRDFGSAGLNIGSYFVYGRVITISDVETRVSKSSNKPFLFWNLQISDATRSLDIQFWMQPGKCRMTQFPRLPRVTECLKVFKLSGVKQNIDSNGAVYDAIHLYSAQSSDKTYFEFAKLLSRHDTFVPLYYNLLD